MKRKEKFRTRLTPREAKEALLTMGEPKSEHTMTMIFENGRSQKGFFGWDRPIYREEFEALGELLRKELQWAFKPKIKKVIVHN